MYPDKYLKRAYDRSFAWTNHAKGLLTVQFSWTLCIFFPLMPFLAAVYWAWNVDPCQKCMHLAAAAFNMHDIPLYVQFIVLLIYLFIILGSAFPVICSLFTLLISFCMLSFWNLFETRGTSKQ